MEKLKNFYLIFGELFEELLHVLNTPQNEFVIYLIGELTAVNCFTSPIPALQIYFTERLPCSVIF